MHPLPPSFDPYLWYWKSPSEDSVADEERYALLLLAKLAEKATRRPLRARHAEEMQLEASDLVHFAAAINRAQCFLRQTLASRSAVSQRDIIRVVQLLRFFWHRSEMTMRGRSRGAAALLLSFGVCYYLGLNSQQRPAFVEAPFEGSRP